MKSASLNELKTELNALGPAEVTELCIRLAKYKKDNKELLTYLLFESSDTQAFIQSIKNEIDTRFEEMNTSNLYFVKKSVRKILRTLNKYARYCQSAPLTIEMLLYFCNKLKHSGIAISQSQQLMNLYNSQVQKTEKLIQTLHEDLQYDFGKELSDVRHL